MPQERLPKQALLAKANGKRIVGRPSTKWINYIDGICLGLHPSEMTYVMEDSEMWRLNLKLLPPQPLRKRGNEERRRRVI